MSTAGLASRCSRWPRATGAGQAAAIPAHTARRSPVSRSRALWPVARRRDVGDVAGREATQEKRRPATVRGINHADRRSSERLVPPRAIAIKSAPEPRAFY